MAPGTRVTLAATPSLPLPPTELAAGHFTAAPLPTREAHSVLTAAK